MGRKGLSRFAAVLVATLAVLAILIFGGRQQGAAAAGSSGARARSSSPVAAAMKSLAAISGASGSFKRPPSTGPKTAPGKTIYAISFGQALPYFAAQTAGLKAAAAKLHWHLHVWDGKFDPSQWLAGVRQAVTAKANGILMLGVDCPSVQSGLQAAEAHHIPVVAIEAFDCSVLKHGAKSRFNWTVNYTEGSLTKWVRDIGKYAADWAIVHEHGHAKVLLFDETDAVYFHDAIAGFEKELKRCGGCGIVDTVQFTAAAYGPTLQQDASEALLKSPNANIVFTSGAESILHAGVAAAIKASSSKPVAVGVEGDVGAPGDFKSGVLGMAENIVPGWEGFAAMNALVRIFAGKKPAFQSGIGLRLIDRHHNFATFKPYVGPFNYKAIFEKAWGVK
jgi:ribose transport system substrate-binding protein